MELNVNSAVHTLLLMWWVWAHRSLRWAWPFGGTGLQRQGQARWVAVERQRVQGVVSPQWQVGFLEVLDHGAGSRQQGLVHQVTAAGLGALVCSLMVRGHCCSPQRVPPKEGPCKFSKILIQLSQPYFSG